MKLLMENWRAYLSEAQTSDIYGNLYLFEGDEVSKTSFYEAINMLSESDDDADRFLENWERSIDHMFGGLDEAVPIETGVQKVDDAILKASTQAYLALQRLKGKAVGPVMNLVKKMKGFAEKNPKAAKAALYVGSGLAAATTVAAAMAIASDSGMDAEGAKNAIEQVVSNLKAAIGDLEDAAVKGLQDLDHQGNAPENMPNLEPIAPQYTDSGIWDDDLQGWISPKELENKLANLEKMNDTVSKAIQSPELEKAMTGYENTMDQWSDMLAQADKNRAGAGDGGSDTMSKWGDMFAQADADRAAGEAVKELSTADSYEEFMTILVKGDTPDYRALQDLASAIENGKFDDENRKFLKNLIKQMPAGPEKKQLRGFIRARDAGKVLKTILNVTPHGAVVNVVDKLDAAGRIMPQSTDGIDMAGRIARGVTKLGKSLK